MKKILLLLLATCCLAQYACKKGDDDKPRTSTLSAKINGAGFTAENVSVTNYSGYQIIKGSRTGSNESITIISSDTSSVDAMGIYSPNGTAADSSQNFSLTTVTSPSGNSAEGEFDFITSDSVVITEGVYTIYW